MPADPRLAAITVAPSPTTDGTAESVLLRLRDVERRLDALDRGGRRPVYTGSPAPTSSSPDGTLYGMSSTPRLYLRIGGTWRYTTLT